MSRSQAHSTDPSVALEGSVKPRAAAVGRVRVKVDGLHTSYANVVTTNANRDEVALAFGIKSPAAGPGQPVDVCLHTRIVMNPFAAKRLLERLQRMESAPAARPEVDR